jgi:two-component system sensor histidine kinase VicK
MFKSIQWKIVIMYFLLVFLAMMIISAVIVTQLEQYHIDNLAKDLDKQAGIIHFQIRGTSQIGVPEIQNIINSWYRGNLYSSIKEIYILNSERRIIASTEDSTNNMFIADVLGSEPSTLLLASLTMESQSEVLENDKGEAVTMDYAFPVKSADNQVEKIIYLRAGMEQVNETLNQAKTILASATLLALIITVILGSLLARSITGPIKEVTSKAQKMAEGDFDHRLEVKSTDEIGQLTGMFNYLTQQLKQTLEEIAGEKGKMEAILTYMTDGLIAVNVKGRVIHFNPSALRMLGIEDQEIHDRVFDELLSGAGINLSFEQIKEGQISEDKAVEVKDAILRVETAAFKNEQQEIIGYIVVFQDITEQHRLEAMRREFVANVSHEIRTPLTTIRSYVETLLDGVIDDREMATNFLSVVNSEAERMTRLVKDLLLLSRLDYQRARWNKTLFSLEGVVEDIVRKLEVPIKQKGHSVTVTRLSPIPPFEGDKDRIEQVLLNIISNAIKYTQDKGKIEVVLDYNDGQAKIVVSDNGIGIPEADMPRIFERFYRVDKARSRELGGTGLGLAIAKEIIEAHKGEICIDSVHGSGTTVTIRLPV